MKINDKYHKTKTGIIKKNPRKTKINSIYDEDGVIAGNIDVTFSSKKTPQMRGIYTQNNNKIFFNGYWEEGAFQITKLNPRNSMSESALIELEQEISDNYISEYTEEVW